MLSQTLTVLALAATTLAHPYRHASFHGTGGTGFAGVAAPTGGMFPVNGTGNGTRTGPIDSSSLPVVTMTVVPLPATESSATEPTAAADLASASSVTAVAAIASDAGSGPGMDTSTCTSSETVTSIVTSIQYSYVTVTAGADAMSSPVVAAVATDSSSVASLASAIAEAQSSPVSSASISAAQVSAGAFFGQPSRGAASVATTMATMVSSAAASASPAASSQASTSPSSSGSGGRRGLAYNSASLTNAFSGTGMSWAYNWAASPGGSLVSGVEYVPMLWGQNSVSGWASAAASAIASGSKHVLSFNEPDLGAQANMDPSTAAKLHIANMGPLAGKVNIGSPAITNGAGTSPLMGIDWLNQFFGKCNGQCQVDFVTFHWYDSASNFAYFKQHVLDVINCAKQNGVGKVWLTEFGASGSDSQVASFLAQALPFLDSQPEVERYAYFMVDNIMVSGNSLTPVGKAFAS